MMLLCVSVGCTCVRGALILIHDNSKRECLLSCCLSVCLKDQRRKCGIREVKTTLTQGWSWTRGARSQILLSTSDVYGCYPTENEKPFPTAKADIQNSSRITCVPQSLELVPFVWLTWWGAQYKEPLSWLDSGWHRCVCIVNVWEQSSVIPWVSGFADGSHTVSML